jgi:exopolysaccharide biosynthesis predicted pyruvyltransferase EpsI
LNALIEGTRQALIEALDPLIPAGARCALIDFPAHPNVGDSAIWLGERAYLRQRGVNVAYTCDLQNYSKSHLERSIGDGTILIHGGGNFGDLWPHHHRLRLKVLRDFPRQRIIQLPQSVHFERSGALEESKRVIDAHANFVMVTRDRHSFEIFTRHFSQPCHLAPDSAFFLGPQPVGGTPSSEFFWLTRLDKESLGATGPELLNGIPAQDWLQDSPGVERISALLGAAKTRSLPVKRIEKRLYDVLARARLRRGYRMLRQGRVVITERLHGHILCLLAGIPNVLIDNNYGKNAAVYAAWTRDWPGTGFVSTPAAAKARAQQLLEGDVMRTVAV